MPRVPSREDILNISDPRLRLIEAGARVMLDEGFSVLQSGISPDIVAKTAGRTRRTFYDHFDSKSDFVRAVLGRYLDVSEHEVINATLGRIMAQLIEASKGNLAVSVQQISDLNFSDMVSSETTHLQTIAFGLGGDDPKTMENIQTHFSAVDDTFEMAFN